MKLLKPGTKVQIYPGDTYSKFGEILEIGITHFVIKITKAEKGATQKEGDIVALPVGKLSLKIITEDSK